MNGARFDALTRTMARGVSRRQLLRLASGGVTAAIAAALGRGQPLTAQERPPEDRPDPVVFAVCAEGLSDIFAHIPGERIVIDRACPACPREGDVCVAVLTPSGTLRCGCLSHFEAEEVAASALRDGREVVFQ